MNSQEMRKFMKLFEDTGERSTEERHARIDDAIKWLEDHAAISDYPDPWTSRAGVLKTYRRRDLDAAENFIINGDNFLDGGWKDPFGLI